MRLLIDTNILIDVLQNRKEYVKHSLAVWEACESGICEGFVSTLSFANIVYVMRKNMSAQKVEQILAALSLIFQFAELGKSELVQAASLRWDDYEDAIQSVTASRVNADLIVTRNTSDFKGSMVKAITPDEFILLLAERA